MTHPPKTKAELIEALTTLTRGFGASLHAMVESIEYAHPAPDVARARAAVALGYLDLAPLFVALGSLAHNHLDELLLAWSIATGHDRHPALRGELEALRERVILHASAVPAVANRGQA